MYNHYFNDWAISNSHRFAQIGIIQTVRVNEGSGESPNPTVIAEHSSGHRIGQIIVWGSGFMDFEILESKSAKQILWEHRDLKGYPDFESILREYLTLLILPQSP